MKLGRIALFTLVIASASHAAPWMATEKPVKIEGAILGFSWIGAVQVETRGFPLSHAKWEQGPAYLLKLQAPKVDAQTRKAISNRSLGASVRHFGPVFYEVEGDEMFVYLASPRLNEINVGAKIEIADYHLVGDERWRISRTKQILIGGKAPTEVKGPFIESAPTNRNSEQD